MTRTIALLLICLIGAATAAAQSSEIFGVYGQCPFACRYIKINRDFTFEELLDGDLFNGQRKKGTWKFEGKKTIRAKSYVPTSSLHVVESMSDDRTVFVTVLDPNGATLPHAEISGAVNGTGFKCLTSDEGICEIPKSSNFEVKWNAFVGNYQIKNSAANRFQVVLTVDQMEPVIDERWMIERNYLYVEFEGAFDKSSALKRVPAARASKLFPAAKSE